ncbi:hypothetical protein [Actinomadura sp. SCN-SB]|uniref:hypothetical protein n=1 Tax=Actinomadura sp. SCN-SB TaxID=3373092 RepID=UPI0037523D15
MVEADHELTVGGASGGASKISPPVRAECGQQSCAIQRRRGGWVPHNTAGSAAAQPPTNFEPSS